MFKEAVCLIALLTVHVSSVMSMFGYHNDYVSPSTTYRRRESRIFPTCSYTDSFYYRCTCKTGFTFINGGCSKSCLDRYVRINGFCTRVSETCNEYNLVTGKCINCMYNHQFNDQGECVLDKGQNCMEFKNGMCSRCAFKSINVNGICIEPDPLCQTSNEKAECASCFSGYQLDAGKCKLSG